MYITFIICIVDLHTFVHHVFSKNNAKSLFIATGSKVILHNIDLIWIEKPSLSLVPPFPRSHSSHLCFYDLARGESQRAYTWMPQLLPSA